MKRSRHTWSLNNERRYHHIAVDEHLPAQLNGCHLGWFVSARTCSMGYKHDHVLSMTYLLQKDQHTHLPIQSSVPT